MSEFLHEYHKSFYIYTWYDVEFNCLFFICVPYIEGQQTENMMPEGYSFIPFKLI